MVQIGIRRRRRGLLSRGYRVTRFFLRALFRQRSLLFKPNREWTGSPEDISRDARTLLLRTDAGEDLSAWFIPNNSCESYVLLLPSTTGNMSYELDAAAWLNRQGLSVFMVDYPGYGRSGGRPGENACYRAAHRAYDELTLGLGVKPEQLLIYGRSLGASVAVELAHARACAGLIFHNGFSSFPELAARHLPQLLVRLLCRIHFDSRTRVQSITCAFLQIHGLRDRLVPAAMAKQVYEAATTPKRFIELADGHFDSGWQYSSEVKTAWQELISGDARHWPRAPNKRGNLEPVTSKQDQPDRDETSPGVLVQ